MDLCQQFRLSANYFGSCYCFILLLYVVAHDISTYCTAVKNTLQSAVWKIMSGRNFMVPDSGELLH